MVFYYYFFFCEKGGRGVERCKRRNIIGQKSVIDYNKEDKTSFSIEKEKQRQRGILILLNDS